MQEAVHQLHAPPVYTIQQQMTQLQIINFFFLIFAEDGVTTQNKNKTQVPGNRSTVISFRYHLNTGPDYAK